MSSSLFESLEYLSNSVLYNGVDKFFFLYIAIAMTTPALNVWKIKIVFIHKIVNQRFLAIKLVLINVDLYSLFSLNFTVKE